MENLSQNQPPCLGPDWCLQNKTPRHARLISTALLVSQKDSSLYYLVGRQTSMACPKPLVFTPPKAAGMGRSNRATKSDPNLDLASSVRRRPLRGSSKSVRSALRWANCSPVTALALVTTRCASTGSGCYTMRATPWRPGQRSKGSWWV